jgi:predicted negative regulator of RcsB-dependent stress response
LFVDAVVAKDAGKAKAFASLFSDKYADTGYASITTLRYAAFLQDSGKTAEAIKLLQAKPSDDERADLGELRRIRLARLLLISGKSADASQQLAGITQPQFPGIVDELRGDIANAQGKRDDARKAYERALTNLDQAAPTRQLVELKLIEAGGQPPAKPES